MAIEIDVSLHAGQYEVWETQKRFRLIAAGRRWGKTWLGSALCLDVALRGGRAWWIAPTYKVANVGWRGLNEMRAQIGRHISIECRKVDRELLFANGGEVWVKSADNPDSLRGDGLDFIVLDECAYMKEEAWSEALRPALSDRKGAALFISTPHGLNWFRDLWKRGQDPEFPDWQSWSFKTSDNPFIDRDEIESARRTMLERIFRQEYEADFLADNPGALWTRADIDASRVLKAPDNISRVVVAMDPSATSSATADECGIIGAASSMYDATRNCKDDRTQLYVLEDATVRGTPTAQAKAAIAMFYKIGADCIVAEANNGGEWISTVINQIDRRVRVKIVHASRGKQTRAEPVSAVYEHGRGHHVGSFPQLEDEMCQWEPGMTSPNRLDALVWAGTELVLHKRGVFVG